MFGTKFEDIFGFVKDTDNGSGKQPSSDYMFKCLIMRRMVVICSNKR